MNGKDLVTKLQRRLAPGQGSQAVKIRQLSEVLGVSPQTIGNWQESKSLRAADVSNVIVKALNVARSKAESEAVTPLVEFFRIEPAKLQSGAHWELFSTAGDGATHPYRQGLRDKLQRAHGVYVFYDSRGRALYSGKAKKQTLWKEMNAALNREREVQRVFRVPHPKSHVQFKESKEKFRQITSQAVQLHDMAEYVSAYEVAAGLIDVIESILIRSFPNDLLNVRMEKFGGGPQAARKKRAGGRPPSDATL